MGTAESGTAAQLLPMVQDSLRAFVPVLSPGDRARLERPEFSNGLTSFLLLLTATNKVMNLTADADPRHLLTTHVRDSLAPLLAGLEPPSTLLDIGSGGGFPAVPLALAWPETQVTLSESIGKKARFLQRLAEEIPLPRAQVVHGRVEDPGTHLSSGRFDMITARGVARTPTVFHYAAPLLAEGGRLVLWKGEHDLAELDDPPFVAILRRLHCTVMVADYALPDIERNSKLVILQMTPTIGGMMHGRNGL
ncbi:MAG: 16S rRNA (guanine(527)-N(7))-methyltransferase RsmG [Candidatus Cryosericum sp.]